MYRARDLRLDRAVAIKVMAEHIAADPDMRRRFETEAKAVAALSHPNILSIYELVVVDGIPVAVMELLEGETRQPCWGLTLDGHALAEAFRRGGPQEYWRRRLELMELVAAGAPPSIHFARAIVHSHLGQVDEALHQIERMADEHIGGCVFLGVDPSLASLRDHPRYQAVLRGAGVALPRTASTPHTASS